MSSSEPVDEDAVSAAALDLFVRLRDDDQADTVAVELAAWLDQSPGHRLAWEEVQHLFLALDEVPAPATPRRPPVWDRIRSRPPITRRLAAPLIAAGLVGGVLSTGVLTLPADYSTPIGQTRTVILADGSTAVLDAGSAIDVDIRADARRVRLRQGRAWFQVAHEARPFTVQSGSASVRDIGTAFEVDRDRSDGTVAVSEGEVELTVDDGPALRLKQGQAARFSAARAIRIQPPVRVAAWRTGRLEFQDETLEQILTVLERHGAGRFLILDEELKTRRLTGGFDAGRPKAAREAVLARLGAEARTIGPVTVISARR